MLAEILGLLPPLAVCFSAGAILWLLFKGANQWIRQWDVAVTLVGHPELAVDLLEHVIEREERNRLRIERRVEEVVENGR